VGRGEEFGIEGAPISKQVRGTARGGAMPGEDPGGGRTSGRWPSSTEGRRNSEKLPAGCAEHGLLRALMNSRESFRLVVRRPPMPSCVGRSRRTAASKQPALPAQAGLKVPPCIAPPNRHRDETRAQESLRECGARSHSIQLPRSKKDRSPTQIRGADLGTRRVRRDEREQSDQLPVRPATVPIRH
jgi:hypothetical protein